MARSKISWKAYLSCLFLVHFVSDLKTGSAESYEKFVGIHLFAQKVYYHDLTIAVVENTPNNTLLNCELIEVISDEERNETLRDLRVNISELVEVKFNEMIDLMSECSKVELSSYHKLELSLHKPPANESESTPILSNFVIYPDTKWCGAGNIAKNYFDLGPENTTDKCCRSHDFCPVKIQKRGTRYNLTNESFLSTKSHCVCDDELMRCLKAMNQETANEVGKFYFNVLRIECIDEIDGKKQFRSAKHYED